MECYFCDCLNVIVNVKEKETRVIEGSKLLFCLENEDEIENIDSFFKDEVLDVVLNYSGVEVGHSFLTNERCHGDWMITSCLNCGVETHAIHAVKGFDRVLIKKDILHSRSVLNDIKYTSTYSKIFKIKLLDSSVRKNSVLWNHRVNVVNASESINNNVKDAITMEKEAMEERIRIYRETQQQQFHDYKIKAFRQKEDMLQTIKQYESNMSHESLFDTLNESYFGNISFESRDKSTDLPQISKVSNRGVAIRSFDNAEDNSSPIAMSLPSRMQPLSRTNRFNNQPKFSPSKQRSFSETSDDTLFDLDGFQTNKNCEPFYEESDEDSSGDATSLESSGGYNIPSRSLRPGNRVYATSVPVNVPLFKNERNSYEPESDDDDLPTPSPNHIAKSIQAIANSMHDSTSMFGELPRPRLNSQPYSLR